jgi:hypothetical protein
VHRILREERDIVIGLAIRGGVRPWCDLRAAKGSETREAHVTKVLPSQVRLFLQIAGLDQLRMRAPGFAENILRNNAIVDIDAFFSLKATLYTVFHKFYADRTRKPARSDAFDIIISAATPYVEAIVTENHQAEVLRKTMRLDTFLQGLRVFTLKDFRQATPV